MAGCSAPALAPLLGAAIAVYMVFISSTTQRSLIILWCSEHSKSVVNETKADYTIQGWAYKGLVIQRVRPTKARLGIQRARQSKARLGIHRLG